MRATSKIEFVPPPALASLMAEQHGTFSATQAYEAMLSPDEIQWFRDAGALTSIRRGVYVIANDFQALSPLEQHVVRAAGVSHVLKQPVLSHETAAVCSGLELLWPELELLHVTRPELKASRKEAGIHHHCGQLPDGHQVTGPYGAMTSLARTAFDVAAHSTFESGLAVVDSAMRAGVTHQELLDVLESCRPWSGSRTASRAIAAGDGRAANPGESLSRAVLIGHGVEPTDLQVEIFDERGELVGRADFGWLPLKVLGEFDGKAKYGIDGKPGEALWAEKLREDRLRALGYEIVRWTWADLLNPAAFIARLRAALARAVARSAWIS